MARAIWQKTVTDNTGAPSNGAQVTVTIQGGGAATIFSAQSGGSARSNPFTTGSDGIARFYAERGYYNVSIFKAGSTVNFPWNNLGDKNLFDDLANTAFVASTAFAQTLLDDANAAAARNTLGLGTAAVKSVNNMGDIVVAGFTSTGIDDNANATSITISPNGKVGIGGGAGVAALSVQKDISVGGTNPIIFLSEDATSTATPTYIQRNSTTGHMDIYNDGTGSNGVIKFFTGDGSEKARITADGDLLIGKNNSNFNQKGILLTNLGVSNFTRAGNTVSLNRLLTNGTIQDFHKDGGVVGSISVTSSATSYNTSSDYRLKEDVKPIANASEKLLSLNPVDVAWKIDGTRTNTFLAHEYGEVVTDGATGVKDGMRTETYEITPADGENEAIMGEREVPDYQGIDLSKAVPLLTAALQDALKRIAILEGA